MVHTRTLKQLLKLDDARWAKWGRSPTALPRLAQRSDAVRALYASVLDAIDEGFGDVDAELSTDGFLFLRDRGALIAVVAHYAKHVNVHVPYGLELRDEGYDRDELLHGKGRFNQRLRLHVDDKLTKGPLLRLLRRSATYARKQGDPY